MTLAVLIPTWSRRARVSDSRAPLAASRTLLAEDQLSAPRQSTLAVVLLRLRTLIVPDIRGHVARLPSVPPTTGSSDLASWIHQQVVVLQQDVDCNITPLSPPTPSTAAFVPNPGPATAMPRVSVQGVSSTPIQGVYSGRGDPRKNSSNTYPRARLHMRYRCTLMGPPTAWRT